MSKTDVLRSVRRAQEAETAEEEVGHLRVAQIRLRAALKDAEKRADEGEGQETLPFDTPAPPPQTVTIDRNGTVLTRTDLQDDTFRFDESTLPTEAEQAAAAPEPEWGDVL
jgi:hypothetical protein